MEFNQLHFAHSAWLWGILVIPVVWMIFFLFYRPHHPTRQLEKFVDKHLLPFLLVKNEVGKKAWWKVLLVWSVVWTCLLLALAGPRWSFREIEMLSKDQSLVILLDLSESMNGKDVKPSRLVRAKQKIEDVINLSDGVKIGLIAFAADPHMITPLTDDKETIRHILPSLETDLVHVQGSRLSPALEMASIMLEAEPGSNQALLVISDGGFEDGSAIAVVKKLADRGVVVHTMGIGTLEGSVLQDHQGNSIKKNGAPIISKLWKNTLQDISKIGYGSYFEGHYSKQEEIAILKELEKRAEAMEIGKKNRLWDERFYLMIFPILPILLWWLRRGAIFAALIVLLFPSVAQGSLMNSSYFMNSEELAKQALDEGDYATAIENFQDPYRKGVACYKAGDFVEAEKLFRQSSREDVACNTSYNLGNTLVQQQKLKKAVGVYEDLLKKWPTHQKAKENLAFVKQMLAQQQQDPSQSDDSEQDDNQDQDEQKDDDSEKGSKNRDSEDSKDSKDGEKKQDSSQDNGEGSKENNSESENSDKPDFEDTKQEQEREGGDDQEQAAPQNAEEEEEPSEDDDRKSEEPVENGDEENESSQNEDKEGACAKSQEDQDADVWLNRISNDPKKFLKNKFYIESKNNGTTKGIDPW